MRILTRLKECMGIVAFLFLVDPIHCYGDPHWTETPDSSFKNKGAIWVSECGLSSGCVSKDAEQYILTLEEFRKYARGSLPVWVYDYVHDGADYQVTMKDNEVAFSRYRIRPRLMQDVSSVDLSVSVLGHRIPFPIGIAPVGLVRLVHPDGELGIARAAQAAGTVMTVSSLSTTTIENIARAAPYSPRWMQVYVLKDRSVMERTIRKAEASGYSAIVLTLDSPLQNPKMNDIRNNFLSAANVSLPNVINAFGRPSGITELREMLAKSRSWEDLRWVRSITRLPVVAKGIITGHDASLAVLHGASAIQVSNHGGRQLDNVPATIDVLQEVVEAVKGRAEVYLDGGIMTGYDVFKALALGARAVFIGKPAAWGLAYSGQSGVARVLDILVQELNKTMILAGVSTIDSITPLFVTKAASCQ